MIYKCLKPYKPMQIVCFEIILQHWTVRRCARQMCWHGSAVVKRSNHLRISVRTFLPIFGNLCSPLRKTRKYVVSKYKRAFCWWVFLWLRTLTLLNSHCSLGRWDFAEHTSLYFYLFLLVCTNHNLIRTPQNKKTTPNSSSRVLRHSAALRQR